MQAMVLIIEIDLKNLHI